jgi:glycosyltransferase involved in cell wall biosynthesis
MAGNVVSEDLRLETPESDEGEMMGTDGPLVSVLTPVYNGEQFLAACIESVLGQTYQNFEYLILNNCSTDRSLEIAEDYARKDTRIRVRTNEQFVGVIANHNNAFRLIPPAAKYCKVVSADDLIFPDCLTRMVEVAEAHPSVGIVGSYQLSGSVIRWQGFEYPKVVFPGREICRRIFLDGNPKFGFGAPTSLLYRADLVRQHEAFYPNASAEADTSACFRALEHADFGFVYQVLCYEKTHGDTQSSKSATLNRYASANLNDLMQYGPLYLGKEEQARLLEASLGGYHRFLAVNMFRFRGKEFWNYHKGRLEELGYPLRTRQLFRAAAVKALREILNPEQALRKFWGKTKSKAPG